MKIKTKITVTRAETQGLVLAHILATVGQPPAGQRWQVDSNYGDWDVENVPLPEDEDKDEPAPIAPPPALSYRALAADLARQAAPQPATTAAKAE